MRLPIAAAVAGILGSFISPASAADVDPDTSFAVVGYMRAYGCSLNATQVDLFLPDLKIDEETYQSVLADLVDRGFATGDATERDAGVTLTPAFCGVTKGNDPRATLIEVMRYNDCGLSPQDPPRLLMPVGFMPEIGPARRAHAFEVTAIRRQGEVEREDLVLAETPLKLPGADHLDQLGANIAVTRLQHARSLHGECGPAGNNPACHQRVDRRAAEA